MWVKATDKDIQSIKEEIDRAYKIAIERCTGKTYKKYEMWSIYDIIRAFEKTCSRKDWKTYASTPYGSELIENKNAGIKYYIDGWDSARSISFGKINNKTSIASSRGKKIDKWILLARHFSGRVTKAIDEGKLTLKDTVLIDLGFHGDRREDITVYGDPKGRDPLVRELVVFIKKLYRNP